MVQDLREKKSLKRVEGLYSETVYCWAGVCVVGV